MKTGDRHHFFSAWENTWAGLRKNGEENGGLSPVLERGDRWTA